MLQLLGDELIASDRLAVFELVKNSYDADAAEVTVRLNIDRSDEPSIVVRDDGEGMTLDVIRSIWLVPGNEHRKRQRESLQRSLKYNRLPLGEKGVGRFAVHKLGNRIRLITRARNSDECVVDIDWDELTSRPYLDEAPVRIRMRAPTAFRGGKTGTQIRIRQLRRPNWTRGEVRRLQNQITSMCSPFEEPGSFNAVLRVPGHENWLEDLPDVAEILDRAIWRFSFRFEDGAFSWGYEFHKVPGLNLEERKLHKIDDHLQLPDRPGGVVSRSSKIIADKSTTDGIGPISGELYVYDRDREVIRLLANSRLMGDYLDEHGGVRVYRDGIRVYNYGEQGDDWLGLDLRRVNSPTRRISRNIILGAIHLSLERSTGLVEKTNREGFVENEALTRLRSVVIGALSVLEGERHKDKNSIRQLTGNVSESSGTNFERHIAALRTAIRRNRSGEQLERIVNRIEREYSNMQRMLLSAGMSGLNLAVIFHEVDRGVRLLHRVIVEDTNQSNATRHAEELIRTLEGFSGLLRSSRRRQRSARELLGYINRLNIVRFRHHRVRFLCPLLEGSSDGFRSTFEFSLVLGALNNLIDNALYWLRVRWPDNNLDRASPTRMLYVGVSHDFSQGPAIVVADNGPGFRDTPEHMVYPFFTRKPEGMGLGLYYANLAMELNGGSLAFPQQGEVELPQGFDGATVALIFRDTG